MVFFFFFFNVSFLGNNSSGIVGSWRNTQANSIAPRSHRYTYRKQRRCAHQIHTERRRYSTVCCFVNTGKSWTLQTPLLARTSTTKHDPTQTKYWSIFFHIFYFFRSSTNSLLPKPGVLFAHLIHKTTLHFFEYDQRNMKLWLHPTKIICCLWFKTPIQKRVHKKKI